MAVTGTNQHIHFSNQITLGNYSLYCKT